MTNKYFQSWMQNIESQKDIPRITYIDPFLKQTIEESQDNANILDIGCGWGTVAQHLKPNQKYTGIDKNIHFLNYIKQKYNSGNITTLKGELPTNLNIHPNQTFDTIICSMVLHATKHLEKSIQNIKTTTNKNGQINIITFRDSAKKTIINSFQNIKSQTENSITGHLLLPSKIILNNETIHFHPENKLEQIIKKTSTFKITKKQYLGELFISYKIIKLKNI